MTMAVAPLALDMDRSVDQQLRRFSYTDAAHGKELYSFYGNRVIEHVTASGTTVAIKVKTPDAMDSTEADMMHHAATNNILAPKVLTFYDIVVNKSIARAMVSERVPGVPLSDVWNDYDEDQQEHVKDQLRAQLGRMRQVTQPYIGRVDRQPTRNMFDRTQNSTCGPFATEKEFDRWCLGHVAAKPLARLRWRLALRHMRKDLSTKTNRDNGRKNSKASANEFDRRQRFVLTHGDLTPRNIMVDGTTLTGIVDWERSGFYPEYAEYAFAMVLCHEHEKWWIPVLKDILDPCSEQRLTFTRLVEDNYPY
ncbi:unnamed protein product [Clonostachys byssicola]|uniref:Aminoglycoside phosphotransferase domain-containing protein n=1 Tax=Clonostachys byssicola TaxID=160290 RepID=A0A9N9Y8L0_9HYPO|nr:unnamed protein product [Clonostachys byssicola]